MTPTLLTTRQPPMLPRVHRLKALSLLISVALHLSALLLMVYVQPERGEGEEEEGTVAVHFLQPGQPIRSTGSLFLNGSLLGISRWDSVSAEAKRHWEQGMRLKRAKNLDRALAEFQRAIAIAPEYTEAHREYMDILIQKGERQKVIAQYKAQAEQNPDNPVLRYLYGRALGGDDAERQVKEFRRAVELDPDYFWGHYGLGGAYAEEGQLNDALAEYQQALLLKPNSGEAHNNLGRVYYKKGWVDQAIGSYQDALANSPDLPEAHVNLGLMYSKKGQPEDAIEKYREALYIDPDNAQAHRALGIAYGKGGQFDRAIREWEKVIRLQPENAEALYNLGVLYKNVGAYTKALRAFEHFIRLSPRKNTRVFRHEMDMLRELALRGSSPDLTGDGHPVKSQE